MHTARVHRQLEFNQSIGKNIPVLALLNVTFRTVNLDQVSVAHTAPESESSLLVAESGTDVTTVEDQVTEETSTTVLHEDT